MKRRSVWLCFLLLGVVFPLASYAGQLEDGTAAMKRGDYKSAYQLLHPLAVDGNAVAQDAVGTMFMEGLGVGKDERQAASWYGKSAEQGNAQAQYALGVMYIHGQGLEQDFQKGMEYIVEAAKQGLVVAQQDAFALYSEAAKGNNFAALHNVAYMCLKGWAGETDPYDCVNLLESAAQGGFLKSATALSTIYSEGKFGIEPNEEKAAYWKDYANNKTGVPAVDE